MFLKYCSTVAIEDKQSTSNTCGTEVHLESRGTRRNIQISWHRTFESKWLECIFFPLD